jgi:hypothetical protein
MTSRSKEKQAEKSFDDHNALSTLRKSETFIYLTQGEILNKLRNDELYRLTNGGMDWEDYLRQPEVSLTTGQARQMIECYQLFCVNMGMSAEDLGWYPLSALRFILKKYKKGQIDDARKIKEILEASKSLSLRDLREHYHDEVIQMERTYEYVIMKRCKETNNLTKVHEVSSEDIKSKFNLE